MQIETLLSCMEKTVGRMDGCSLLPDGTPDWDAWKNRRKAERQFYAFRNGLIRQIQRQQERERIINNRFIKMLKGTI